MWDICTPAPRDCEHLRGEVIGIDYRTTTHHAAAKEPVHLAAVRIENLRKPYGIAGDTLLFNRHVRLPRCYQ